MQFYQIPLKAGVAYTLSASGRIFLIDAISGAQSVDVTLLDKSGSARQIMPGRKVLFKCETDYSGVILKAATDAVVSFFVSFDEVHNGYADGGNVTVPGGVKVTNLDGEPVPISFPGGVVNMTASNVGINNVDANAVPVQPKTGAVFTMDKKLITAISDLAPVAVGLAAVQISNDATLKRLRVRNSHATAIIALGGPAVTLANGAIQLAPGDMWVEEDAPGAAWYAISDTAATNVQMQGLK